MILPCNCKHSAQDALYGLGKRVHNPIKQGKEARCTVCGKERALASQPVKAIGKSKKEARDA